MARRLLRGAARAVALACALGTSAPARAGDPSVAPAPPATDRSAAEWLEAGAALEAAGELAAAASTYRLALRAANLAGDEAHAAEAYGRMEAAARRAGVAADAVVVPAPAPVSRLTFVSFENAPPGATITVDEGVPGAPGAGMLLAPGSHEIVLRLPGEPARRTTLGVPASARAVVDLADSDGFTSDHPPEPVRASERPITIAGGTVSLEAAGAYGATAAGPALEMRLGLLSQLELRIAEAFYFFLPAGPLVGLRWSPVRGDVELAIAAEGRAPGLGGLPGGYFALEARFHPHEVVAIDTGVSFSALHRIVGNPGYSDAPSDKIDLDREDLLGLSAYANTNALWAPTVEPGIPLSLTVSPLPELYLAVRSGFGMLHFEAPSSMFVPLSVRLGGTIPSDGEPMLDIELTASLPMFIMPVPGDEEQRVWPASKPPGRVLRPDLMNLSLALRGYVEAWP